MKLTEYATLYATPRKLLVVPHGVLDNAEQRTRDYFRAHFKIYEFKIYEFAPKETPHVQADNKDFSREKLTPILLLPADVYCGLSPSGQKKLLSRYSVYFLPEAPTGIESKLLSRPHVPDDNPPDGYGYDNGGQGSGGAGMVLAGDDRHTRRPICWEGTLSHLLLPREAPCRY